MTHTLGPWHLGGIFDSTTTPRTSVWGPTPADAQSGEWIAKDVRLANATLIAAAPDLLDVLNSLRNEAVGFLAMADPSAHGQTNLACLQRRIDEADAVIAKAEGRDQTVRP